MGCISAFYPTLPLVFQGTICLGGRFIGGDCERSSGKKGSKEIVSLCQSRKSLPIHGTVRQEMKSINIAFCIKASEERWQELFGMEKANREILGRNKRENWEK
jgi:hypothetical protein